MQTPTSPKESKKCQHWYKQKKIHFYYCKEEMLLLLLPLLLRLKEEVLLLLKKLVKPVTCFLHHQTSHLMPNPRLCYHLHKEKKHHYQYILTAFTCKHLLMLVKILSVRLIPVSASWSFYRNAVCSSQLWRSVILIKITSKS